ncbi:PAS domain S-box protein [Tahibacter amnicola]|uniref:histidine kinase n=1 Tax=Tahibacter amnicola TaxID=2976241 RepID=A0ABY6BKI8_9GAMM|nr:PAS domain S-box protein [Tahibacter amnicola]UXI70380.1 PAS domain S-box protein [Tahibacter amnicola]
MSDLGTFFTGDFMPHGYCFRWLPGLVWLHVISDGLTALAYTSIPFTLFYFIRKRRDLPFNWMFLLFAIFIIACGATHYLEIWTLWNGAYWFSGVVKAITAAASVPTAILLAKLVPQALAIPSIHELREANRRLQSSEARFRGLLESAPDAVVIVDAMGTIALVNQQTERMLGFHRDELIGKPVEVLMPIRYRYQHAGHRTDYFRSPRSRSMGAKLDLYGLRKDGSEFPVEISLSPLETEEGTLVSAAIRDVTERKQQELRVSRLATIVESSEDAMYSRSLDGSVQTWNRAAEHLYGYSADEMIGQSLMVLIPPSHVTPEEVALAVHVGEHSLSRETLRLRKDGSTVEVAVTVSPIRDSVGRLIGACTVARDVTEEKRIQEQLRASVHEKEILLKEVHHRVKNNLQVISTLINMQMRSISGSAALMALEECQSRVQAIALIHEKLYQSKDYARVPFAEYARSLALNVFDAAGALDSAVTLETDFADVAIAVDRAIPCALILNELVSNALKHAFDRHQKGTVTVALRRDPDGLLVMSVCDNGRGLPPDLERRRASSLGMELVQTLVEQLDASMEIVSGKDNGTQFTIRFAAGENL